MIICKKTLDFYHLLPSHPPHLFHLHIWPAPSPLPRTAAPAPPPLLRSAASSAWRARRVGPSSRPGRWMEQGAALEQGRRSSRGPSRRSRRGRGRNSSACCSSWPAPAEGGAACSVRQPYLLSLYPLKNMKVEDNKTKGPFLHIFMHLEGIWT